MSASATEAFDRTPYAAPEAELLGSAELKADKLFSAEGRVGVLRYNARVTIGLFAMLVAAVIGFTAIATESSVAIAVGAVPAAVLFIGALVLLVHTAIKRLHDLNYSGWYYLIGMIPIVGALWALYYSLKPASQDDNKFGAFREATTSDKVLGYIGIFLTVAMTIGAIIPSSVWTS